MAKGGENEKHPQIRIKKIRRRKCKMKTVALIPIKLGSKRVPGKNIKPFFDGTPINFNPDYFPRTQDLPLIYGETSIVYVFTKESFLKHHRRLGIHPFIKEVDKIEAMDIDYPEDLEICNAIYKEVA